MSTTVNWGLWCTRCGSQIARREKSERRMVRLAGEQVVIVMHTECPENRVLDYDEQVNLNNVAPTVNSLLPMKVPK